MLKNRFGDNSPTLGISTAMNSVATLEELNPGQVGLLQVDPWTGIPVNASGGWVSADEKRYLAFDSEADAWAYAARRLQENPLTEWALLDSQGNHLATADDPQSLHAEVERLKREREQRRGWFFKLRQLLRGGGD